MWGITAEMLTTDCISYAHDKGLNGDYVLSFGKYKGQTISAIIDLNPWYIRWAIKEKIISLNIEMTNLLTQALERKLKETGKWYPRHSSYRRRYYELDDGYYQEYGCDWPADDCF